MRGQGVLLTEVQFLKCLSECLGEEEVDEDDLKYQPDDVHDEIFPVDGFKADGVDEGAWEIMLVDSLWNEVGEEAEGSITE